MISLVLSILIPITTGIMGIIAYKYPFHVEGSSRFTNAARFFLVLTALTVIGGGYLAYDTFKASQSNSSHQKELKDTIGVIKSDLKNLLSIIDRSGYKLTPQGKIIPKKSISNMAIVKSGNPTIQQNTVKAKESIIQQSKEGVNKSAIVKGDGNFVDQSEHYEGIKQRHLTNDLFAYITSQLPSKNARISFWLKPQDKESINLVNEILNALIQTGFTNVNFTPTWWYDINDFDKILVRKSNTPDSYEIVVYPQPNVR